MQEKTHCSDRSDEIFRKREEIKFEANYHPPQAPSFELLPKSMGEKARMVYQYLDDSNKWRTELIDNRKDSMLE